MGMKLLYFNTCAFYLTSLVREVQETLSNDTVTEPLISDFQDFVLDMQKTITSLRKQVCLCSLRN